MTRLLALMARDELDALVLSQESNVHLVSGALRLWLAGTRPFNPSCVVLLDGSVHVLSNTDAVLPDTFPAAQLYGTTWNRGTLSRELAAIAGLRDAQRVGVDGMNVSMHSLLSGVAPDATFLDATPLFEALWTESDDGQAAAVERAADVARAGLAAMASALRPGVQPRVLRGVCAETLASKDVTTPAFEAVATPLSAPSSWLPGDEALAGGDRVVLRVGVLRDGWQATVARTYVVETAASEAPPPAGWADAVAACVPGTAVGSLRTAAAAEGVGRGLEAWPDHLTLVPGLVMSLECRDELTIRQDVLRVTQGRPVNLTAADDEGRHDDR